MKTDIRKWLPSLWAFVSAILLSMALTGCSTIKLVGDYDEQIDKGTTQLQKDAETFLVKLEASADKPKDKVESYEKNKSFYDGMRVSLSGLRVRADSMERNSITVRMLDKLANNFKRLEGMHKDGLAKAEIDDIRGAINSQFTAILTFELAKKRGEKVDDTKAQSPATPAPQTEGGQK